MNHELVFLSGLPRSGSTILTSLLNQHPKIHATTTSPVLGMILNFGFNWENQVIHQIEDRNENQKLDMQRSMLQSAHAHFNKPIIVDKNRGWPAHIELVQKLTGKKPKIICTTRDVPSVLASFVKLAEKNKEDNFIDNELNRANFTANNTNRCRLLWRQGVVGESWKCFLKGYQYDKSCLLIITYEDIVERPLEVMKKIENFLEIEHHTYDINNLKAMSEKDEFHGMKGLHDIRPVIKKVSPSPEKIIGVELTELYNKMKLDFWNK